MAEEAIVTAGDLGGDAAGVLDPGKLAWAVRVVMTHRRIGRTGWRTCATG